MEELHSSNTTDEKSRKRSQRVVLACLPCRQGKLKCNRDYPVCDQCHKRSRESTCVYTERGLRYNAAKQRSESMREKIDRLETFVNRIKDSKPTSNESIINSAIKRDAASNASTKDVSPLIGNLRLSDSGSTQYTAPSHWESLIEDIADVKAYFDDENSPGTSESNDSVYLSAGGITSVDITFGISPGYTREDLFQFLPQKSEMDRYVSAWFNAPDPMRIILHGPTFQQEYQRFWESPNSVSVAWMAMLFAVSGLGAEIGGQSRQDPSTTLRAEDLRRMTSHALVLADYAAPQPYVIETLLLHTKALLFKHHDTTRQIWQLYGLVMRLCLLAGYHRDLGNNPAMPPFDTEMRRRVWMLACEYDILTSHQMGMASLLNRNMCDTALPSNRLDSDFSKESMPPPRPSNEYTPILFELYYSKVVTIFGEVMCAVSSTTLPSRAETDGLYNNLYNTHEELPQVLKFVPMDQSFMDPSDLILDRFRLEMLHFKVACVLYRPFLGRSGCEHENRRCLEAAESTINLSIPFVEAGQPSGQLANLTVFTRRHVHDFSLAAMILCSELKRCSNSNNIAGGMIDSNTIRHALLKACTLWILSGVTSPKERHAISAIEKFLLQDPRAMPTGASSGANTTSNHFDATDLSLTGTADFEFNNGLPVVSETVPQLENPLTDFQGTFNIEQDPLFLDLFGSAYSTSGTYEPSWP